MNDWKQKMNILFWKFILKQGVLIRFGCIWDTSAIRFLRIICTIRNMIASNVSLSTLFSWNSDIRSLISLCACLHRFLKICAMPFDFICFCRI